MCRHVHPTHVLVHVPHTGVNAPHAHVHHMHTPHTCTVHHTCTRVHTHALHTAYITHAARAHTSTAHRRAHGTARTHRIECFPAVRAPRSPCPVQPHHRDLSASVSWGGTPAGADPSSHPPGLGPCPVSQARCPMSEHRSPASWNSCKLNSDVVTDQGVRYLPRAPCVLTCRPDRQPMTAGWLLSPPPTSLLACSCD